MARDRDGEIASGRQDGLEERVIKIRRCAAVVKGGRRFSFNALVVVGDKSGKVAWGYGKANEVPPAVEKAAKDAQETLKRQTQGRSCKGETIPHRVIGRFGGSRVILVPAGPGTGVKAGPGVREVLVCCGVHNILTKMHGSTNPINLVKATIQGLLQLRTREEVARLRGVTLVMDLSAPYIRASLKLQAEEARRPRPGQRPRQDRLARRQGPVGQRRRQEAQLDLRRRPDAAVPPHPQARLQPCHLGQDVPRRQCRRPRRAFDDGDIVDAAALKKAGLAKGPADGVRILGTGEVTKKLTVKAHHFSKSAAEKITGQGRHGGSDPAAQEADAQQDEAARRKRDEAVIAGTG